MITKESMGLLHDAIQKYNNLATRDYLLACNINKQHPIEYIIVRINKHNFWHLLGCRIIKNESNENIDLYGECLLKKDISEHIEYTHTAYDLKVKHNIFMNIFDFVNNAKNIKICKTYNTPEYYQFKIAVGHHSGIIGYDYENKSLSILYPKTTQNKSIDNFKEHNTTKRIIYILSKAISDSSFNKVEYSPSENVFKKVILELPANINSSIREKYRQDHIE